MSPDQQQQWLAGLIEYARLQPGGRLGIRDQTGAVIASVQVNELAKRPKDMPRSLRPKRPLSKRQRVAAKRSKLAAESIEERPR